MPDLMPRKTKKHQRNIVVDWLQYVVLRSALVFVFVFDVQTILNFACLLGSLLWKHYTRGRERALHNLRISFPDKDEAWLEAVGHRSFQHIVMLAADVLFTPRLVKKYNWRDYSRFKTAERAKWMIKEGKGMLMVAAHYANFEILGYMLGLFGYNIYSIARPFDNRFLNRYLYGVRQRAGQRIIDKKGASRLMGQIIAEGATLCFIADQDAGRKGVFVDFFGRKASTYKSIALLAMAYHLPIGVGYSRRVGNRFFFEIGVNRIIMPDEWADKDDPMTWITAEYTRAIERFVREDPSQYWWLHRRWKHRPKGEIPDTEQVWAHINAVVSRSGEPRQAEQTRR